MQHFYLTFPVMLNQSSLCSQVSPTDEFRLLHANIFCNFSTSPHSNRVLDAKINLQWFRTAIHFLSQWWWDMAPYPTKSISVSVRLALQLAFCMNLSTFFQTGCLKSVGHVSRASITCKCLKILRETVDLRT